MKRFVSAICASLLCVTLCGNAFAANISDFDDVVKDDWYYEAVEYTVNKNMFNGTSETSFAPESNMNRAMFVTVLSRYAGTKDTTAEQSGKVSSEYVNLRDKPTTIGSTVLGSVKKDTELVILGAEKDTYDSNYLWYKVKYSNNTAYIRNDLISYTDPDGLIDINGDEYYACHVKWAVDNNIAVASNKEFKPLEDITREVICEMLYNFLDYSELKLTPSVDEKEFTDGDKINNSYKDAVEMMQKCGVVGGYTDGSFRPQNSATRAEVATFLYRFLTQYEEAKENGDDTTPTTPTDSKVFVEFLAANEITRSGTMTSGSAKVNISDCAKFVYESLSAIGADFYSPYIYTDSYKSNIPKEQYYLKIAKILNENDSSKQMELLDAVTLTASLAMYRDSEMYGNESDYVTGKMLKSYYELVYPSYKKYAKYPEKIVSPDSLLSGIGLTESGIVTRESYSKLFIALREASTGYKVDLSTYDPMYRIVDIEGMDEMKMLHKLNVFQSGYSFYLHPERKLNIYEFRELFGRMLAMSNCYIDKQLVAYYPTADEVFQMISSVYEQEPWENVPYKELVAVTNDSKSSVYMTQFDGSEYEGTNSGPTSAAMMYNWYVGKKEYTGAEARNTKSYPDGNWTAQNIQNWLEEKDVPMTFAPNREYDLKYALDTGALVQAMIDDGTGPHALIVSGYKVHGKDIWFELLDPSDDAMDSSNSTSSHTYVFSSVLDYNMSVRADRLIIVKK